MDLNRFGVRLVLVVSLGIGGCAVNSDGSVTHGFRGSNAWQERAPPQDVIEYYDAMSLAELCDLWTWAHRSGTLSSAEDDAPMLDSLRRRGHDLSVCDATGSSYDDDPLWLICDKLQKAERRLADDPAQLAVKLQEIDEALKRHGAPADACEQ